MQSVIVF